MCKHITLGQTVDFIKFNIDWFSQLLLKFSFHFSPSLLLIVFHFRPTFRFIACSYPLFNLVLFQMWVIQISKTPLKNVRAAEGTHPHWAYSLLSILCLNLQILEDWGGTHHFTKKSQRWDQNNDFKASGGSSPLYFFLRVAWRCYKPFTILKVGWGDSPFN